MRRRQCRERRARSETQLGRAQAQAAKEAPLVRVGPFLCVLGQATEGSEREASAGERRRRARARRGESVARARSGNAESGKREEAGVVASRLR